MKRMRGIPAVVVSILFCVLIFSPQVFAANTATLSVSPASGSLKKGATLTAVIYENSGSDMVNAVQANISYSTSQVQYLSFSNSSAFAVEAQDPSGNTGTLDFARGTITPVSGAQQVVTVRFTVVAASGSIKLNFAGGSAVVRSTDNGEETLTTTGSSYSVTAATTTTSKPKPAPKPLPVSYSEPSPISYALTPTPAVTHQQPTSSGALSISNLQVASNDTSLSTTITWQTNKPSTSIVAYGQDKSHLVTSSDGTMVVSHSVTLVSSMLQAGASYYYYVTSTDAAGDKVSSQLLPFIAAGASKSSNGPNVESYSAKIATVAVILVSIVIIYVLAKYARESIARRRDFSHHFPDIPVAVDPNVTPAEIVHPADAPPQPGSTIRPPTLPPSLNKK